MPLTVLAIDDSRTIRELLREALVQAGFEVHLAIDGLDGLEKLEAAKPHAVITDINMPRMDGFGFIRAVREQPQHSALPIIVLTTESAAELKARAREAGATAWIVKPFDEAKLVSALRRVAVA
ncbi:response regulator [Cereibacter johrii]|uniref:Two-component system chemotaxis response regulator CheY n=1 Tax=Cereibacter johrii TaxID=445629 RepID=A0ABX5JGB8_9RHOB|nr:response regulator [Cereibacter johrii]QCP85907.1 response regulator [Cereibacter sphaeroides]RDS96320.1 response regulator [Cereibacter sphaeroides f. sp. denitrificans]MEA5161654.1 response regulator [Cereibacter johrii]ODM41561.1 Fis family transcriptional regulator [Cereibacter johrii]PTM81807.1 two-component system chemotaxis response regulator CheY [Cereibacter johrii]